MKFTLQVWGPDPAAARRAELLIAPDELASIHLHLATPEVRNRSEHYLRRHGVTGAAGGTPNVPVRAPREPRKLTIAEHLEQMRRDGVIPTATPSPGPPSLEPAMFAVPVSDLVANLLRPCFHRNGLGAYRLFHYAGEPIEALPYWCACFFRPDGGPVRLELRWVKFDPRRDLALDLSGADLLQAGLVWAAALVPLVVGGRALSAVEIASYDYDLRHILSRESEEAIRAVYQGWFDRWDRLVAEAVSRHEAGGTPFARFYHSALGLDRSGNIHIWQAEAELPGLAADLARRGMHAAGLLDSGGSCAIYDVWLDGYLNHSWYYREPRGAVLVFELTSLQQLPEDRPGSWVCRRKPR